jgi:hypothetical protein
MAPSCNRQKAKPTLPILHGGQNLTPSSTSYAPSGHATTLHATTANCSSDAMTADGSGISLRSNTAHLESWQVEQANIGWL